ncbi:hypothetical protein VPHF99_0247 [Vibrio phage F99]
MNLHLLPILYLLKFRPYLFLLIFKSDDILTPQIRESTFYSINFILIFLLTYVRFGRRLVGHYVRGGKLWKRSIG